ncbi:MAG: HlyD family efflux transporter periplasmic adaptor subunit, partial [Pseudomonadota bacterium]
MKRLIILCFALILAAASYLGLAATGTIDDPETKEFAVRTLGLSTNASAAPQDINSNSLDDVSADKASAGSTADAATTGAPTVSVTRVSNSSFVGRVLLTGSFVAREQILLTPEIDGVRIIEISTEAGDMVEKGQVLARLQRVPIEAELAANQAADQRLKAERRQVQSQLSEADAVLAEADKALKRAKSLKTSGFLSDSVFDQRETALQTARARVATASDGLALIDARLAENAANRQAIAWRLSQTKVTAPVAGRIAKRNARIGARVVQGGEPLFEITEDGDVEVMADVDDTQIG